MKNSTVKYCVVDEFNNGLTNWCGLEKASREYVISRNRGEAVKMLEKVPGKAPVELPEL